MKRILSKTLLSAAVLGTALPLGSCVEDKGNYTYDFHDGIYFPVDASTPYTFEGTAGMEVTFSPRLGILDQNTDEYVLNYDDAGNIIEGRDNNAAGDFAYQWYDITAGATELICPAPAEGGETSSPASTLRYLIPAGRQTGDRTLELRAQNTRSGAVFARKYTLKITSVMQMGFMMLTQKGSDVNMDMLALYQNQFIHLKDVLDSPAEADRYPGRNRTAVDLVAYRDQFEPQAGLKKYALWILTKEGCDRVSPIDFSCKPSYSLSNTVPNSSLYLKGVDVKPERLIVQSTQSQGNMNAAFYFDGNWYWQSQMPGNNTFKWENPVNIPSVVPTGGQDAYTKPKGQEIPVTHHAALIRTAGGAQGTGGGGMLMWTKDNRFIYKTSTGGSQSSARGSMVSVNVADAAGTTPPFFSADYRMIQMGERTMNNSAYAVVYNNDTKKYHILVITANTTVPHKSYDFPLNSDLISEAKAKFRSFNAGWYMQVATHTNEVWSIYLDDSPAELDLTPTVNPDKHEIVVFRSFAADGHMRANVVPNSNMWLYVVTKDPSKGEDDCCTLAVYRPVANATDGSMELATYTYTGADGAQVVTPMKWPGLGNTVALEWKDL